MKSRSAHRPTWQTRGGFVAAWLAAALALGGCTGDQSKVEDDGGPQGAEQLTAAPEPVPSVELAAPADLPQVIADDDAQTAAFQMSKALFDSSPVVVLAAPDGGTVSTDITSAPTAAGEPPPTTEATKAPPNAAGDLLAAAAAAAVDLGVPLLLSGEASLEPELDRLGVETVVVFGEPADGWGSTAEGREILRGPDEASQVPEFTAAAAAAGAPALVLTLDAGESAESAESAALATAEAAGATVESITDPDPRASADTIELLREHEGKSVLALGPGFGSVETFTDHVNVALSSPQLPGGGQLAFPGRRMVALYGHPGTSSLGVLGEQDIDGAIARAKELAAQYQPHSDVPVIPAFEIITTVAAAAAGADGDYSTESSIEKIEPWVDAAQEAGVYVVLDLQPGHTDFLSQAKLYAELLKRPHVGLALDPEWRLGPGDRHMVQIGSVDAAEVNQVSAWLAELTRKNNLPQKVLILHQFSLSMITNRDQLETGHSELAIVLHADGHGGPGNKLATYNALQTGLSEDIWMAWKNFYDEDSPTFSPKQTYTDIDPKPWFVSYQ